MAVYIKRKFLFNLSTLEVIYPMNLSKHLLDASGHALSVDNEASKYTLTHMNAAFEKVISVIMGGPKSLIQYIYDAEEKKKQFQKNYGLQNIQGRVRRQEYTGNRQNKLNNLRRFFLKEKTM
ncbi:hypothetical protein EGR_07039 [Echinococcus granulosus]|uniref:Uncharacterized protein n=1 Tax=Echinococcus granulosus TaxID=6210 RepID=W6UX83_ECHGR|nr:hypothetical protein EGR_07039 [Echinococcus granulosus]EUB58119.1 hypothetical protein EGR_07039 [Echinococcus granulosus]